MSLDLVPVEQRGDELRDIVWSITAVPSGSVRMQEREGVRGNHELCCSPQVSWTVRSTRRQNAHSLTYSHVCV